MAHHYGLPILVTTDPDGRPTHFVWRGETYHVEEVLGTWHLMDRWWVSPVSYALGHEKAPPTDRQYFRLRAEGHQVFDVYYDAANNVWVLDRALD